MGVFVLESILHIMLNACVEKMNLLIRLVAGLEFALDGDIRDVKLLG